MSVGVKAAELAPPRVATPTVGVGMKVPGSVGRTKAVAPGIAIYVAGL